MAKNELKIDINTQGLHRITTLRCAASSCRHNGSQRSHGEAHYTCNYKNAVIDEEGRCMNYERGE